MAHLWHLVLVYGIGFNYHIGQIQHNHNSITYIVLSNYDHSSISYTNNDKRSRVV